MNQQSSTPHPIHPEAAKLRKQLQETVIKYSKWDYSTGKRGSSQEIHFYTLKDLENLKTAILGLASEACWAADRAGERKGLQKANDIIGNWFDGNIPDYFLPLDTREQELAALQSSTEDKQSS